MLDSEQRRRNPSASLKVLEKIFIWFHSNIFHQTSKPKTVSIQHLPAWLNRATAADIHKKKHKL